jgi:hypothetical protein
VTRQFDNNMRGTLGKNDRREKDTQPEYTGKCEIDGKLYWISGWVKEGQGRKFFSLSFRAQDGVSAPSRSGPVGGQKPNERAPAPDADDSVPF